MRILLALFCFEIISCSMAKNKEIDIRDIRIFQNTEAWDLAQAVNKENIRQIVKLAQQNGKIIDRPDPNFGITLLIWSIKMERFKAFETLLKLGANPNIKTKDGSTPLFFAVEYSWIDNNAKKSPKYVQLLLKYGANPNIVYTGHDSEVMEHGTAPLMISSTTSYEKTKALVEDGAEINSKTITGKTAASIALAWRIGDAVNIAYYLIVEKGAKVDEPYYYYNIGGDQIDFDKPHYPIESLEDWLFDIGSDEYHKKIAIINAFKKQGQDYWSKEKHPKTIERIKKLYPDSWEEYLRKY